MTCSKRKDPINSRARTKPWEIQILSTVSLSLLHTVPWAPEHPSCTQHLSLCFNRSPAVTGGTELVAFYDHLPLCLLISCSLNILWENMCLFSSFCICFSTSFNYASVIPAAICEGLSSSQHLKYLCITHENHAKFLYWNSKPNQADLISK